MYIAIYKHVLRSKQVTVGIYMHIEYKVRNIKYKACSRDMHMEWSPNSIWNVARDIFYNASTSLQDDTVLHEWWLSFLLRCLYKRYHLLNVSLDNRVSFFSALSDASLFDLCLYALWPRQFQSRDNFPSPAKTVRHASLCHYFSVWIIVSPLPPWSETRYLSQKDVAILCACCRWIGITVSAAPIDILRSNAHAQHTRCSSTDFV